MNPNQQEHTSLVRRFHTKIGEELEQAGYEKEAVETAISELEEKRFYSVAVLLASDPSTLTVIKERAVDEFLEKLNSKTSLDTKDLLILKSLFTAIAKDDEKEVQEILCDPGTRQIAVDAISKHYSFPIANVREALHLIESGVYKQDLIGVTRMTIQLKDEAPGWLPTKNAGTGGLKAIGNAIKKDGLEQYMVGRKILKDLCNNRVPTVKEKDLGIFDDTLRALTSNMEAVDDLFDWSAKVLDVPSVQISVAIWSSLHGVKLGTQEIIALQQSLEQRDLKPVAARLMTRVTEKLKNFLWLS